MVSKKILGVAIAAAFASQGAFAALNLNGTPVPNKIAKQAILSSFQVGSTGFYTALDGGTASTDFDVVSKLGAGLTVDQRIYIRVNLNDNARFSAQVQTSDLTVTSGQKSGDWDSDPLTPDTLANVNGTVDTITQGGAPGDQYVVFSVKPYPGTAFSIGDTATLAINQLSINGSDVGVEVITYDQAAYAVAGLDTNKLFRSGSKTIITFPTDGVSSSTSAPQTVTASVDSLFKKFAGNNTTAQFSQLYTTVGNYSDLNGNSISLVSITDPSASVVKYKGDFSVGTWSVSASSSCTTPTALTLNGAKTEGTVTLAVSNTKAYLCVVETGAAQIPVATYKADVTYSAPATAVFGAASPASDLAAGSIVRDGTTVLLPFININPDYNQKVIIVNRSSAAADLTLTNLVPDAAATASSITAGTINLPAGKQSVLKSTDLVSITGSAKGAVTLNIAAPSNQIDVLFQTTNAQGAQNTVLLQNDGGKFGTNNN